jgi:Putative adhesin
VRGVKQVLIVLALFVVLVPAAIVLADVAFQNTTVTTHTFPGPIDEVVVRSGTGDVELVPGRGLSVRVRETRHYLFTQPTLERAVRHGTLTLEARCGATLGVTCESDLRVSVPAGATVRLDVGAGDVDARGIDAGEARLKSDSGDLRLELIGRQQRVRARTDSGDVDVRVRDARLIDAQTDSGDVIVAASARPRRIRAVTDSGNVRIVVPAGQYATTPKTDSGNVTVDGISRNDRATSAIEARTDSGDVTLNGQ